LVAWLAVVPVAFAQSTTMTAVAEGEGNARALELSILGKRIEVGRAKANVHVETPTGTKVTGMAGGICNLLGDSTTDCNLQKETSSSVGDNGNNDDSCLVETPDVAGLAGILDLGVGCQDSNSKVTDNKATGSNIGRLAKIGVGLDLSGILSTVTGVTGPDPVANVVKGAEVTGVFDLVKGTVGGAGLPAGTDELTDVITTVQNTTYTVADLLDDILTGVAIKGTAAEISALEGTVNVTNDGPKTKIASDAATLKVNLLAVELGDLNLPANLPIALPDLSQGLLQLEVTPSHAEATFNADSGICNSDAKSSLARLKVANLLGGGGFTTIEVPDLSALNSILGVLGDVLSISINKTTVSPPKTGQNGDTCSAYASGLEVHALKGIGGGISLRVAAVDAGFGGNAVPQRLAAVDVKPPLPTTGGPTYLYWAIGAALGVASFGAFQLRRRMVRSEG
ncbi:MAG: hypothetical protein ACRDIA_03205, partial [Actinomycetota bacterium]